MNPTHRPKVAFWSVLVTLSLVTGCRKEETRAVPGPALPTAAVRVQAAASKTQPTNEEVVATVRAKLRASLEAKLSGRIEHLPVVLGQTVKAGQLIARLEAGEIKAKLDQAQANLQQAERDWKRASSLIEQQAVTRSDYDAADSRYQIAKAAVREAQAMMSYVEVLAPFDGVVTKKWADVGDLAVPGKPLVDLEDPSALQLEADVPEAIGSAVKAGGSLAVHLDSPTRDLTGTVSEVAPASDPVTRTFRVKLTLPQAPGLMSGQFARLLIPVGESNTVRVPASAVVLRGQLEIVFVVTNECAQLHLVKTGKRLGDEIEILAGVEPDEAVVIDGAALLTDGQRVVTK